LTLFLQIAPHLLKVKFDGSARLVYLCALAISAVATLLPLFRAVAVALVFCLALIEILLHTTGKPVFQTLRSLKIFRSRRLRLYLVMSLLVVIPTVVLLEMQRDSSIVRRLTSPRNLYARLATWQTAAKIVAENPMFGVGIANYSDYFDAKFSDWREEKDFVEGAKAVDTPHSNFLWIASELGLAGLAFYLLAYAYLLQMGYRMWKRARTGEERLRGGFFLVLVLAYTLPGLTLASGTYSDLNLYCFFLLGMVSKSPTKAFHSTDE
jgi:O-antigen ligase